MLFISILRRLIRNGHLTLIDATGRTHVVEAGSGQPRARIRLHDKALPRRLLLHPQLALGEAYMDGTMTVEEGGIDGLLDLLMGNTARRSGSRLWALRDRARLLARRLEQYRPVSVSRRNAAHHYDLSMDLFESFLDSDMQYSCAYFLEPGLSLEDAQTAKIRHLAAKLLVEPGQRVLDIGSGWGGLALALARSGARHVTGITLSREQLTHARDRAERLGLAGRVDFQLADYREIEGPFDRIVSVGMFEHVGVNQYGRFFDQLNRMLTDDGVAVLHSIGRLDGPGVTNPWITKYIFPGGYTPALSEVIPVIERSGLFITDVEILRLHYAETLKEWRRRFHANQERMAALYDDRFCRMWEFYLAGSEMAFRHQSLVVFQVQMAKRIDAVPITRDYIRERKQAATLAAAQAAESRRGEAA